MVRKTLFALVLAGLCGGCASKDLLAELPDAAGADSGLCGSGPPPTVFLNRNPTLVSPGENDSEANTSTIVSQPLSTLGWQGADADFEQVMTCVSGLLAPFGVVVTDQSPSVDHIEIVMTGSSSELDLPNIFSIAPNSCGQNRRAMGFVFFAQGWTIQDMCEEIGFPIGVISGAHYSMVCYDIMNTFNGGCSADFDPERPRMFIDAEGSCGSTEPEACSCTGRATQNTYQLVSDFFASYCGGGA